MNPLARTIMFSALKVAVGAWMFVGLSAATIVGCLMLTPVLLAAIPN